jgi:hypothetical protein
MLNEIMMYYLNGNYEESGVKEDTKRVFQVSDKNYFEAIECLESVSGA